jgi:hypothetical protein
LFTVSLITVINHTNIIACQLQIGYFHHLQLLLAQVHYCKAKESQEVDKTKVESVQFCFKTSLNEPQNAFTEGTMQYFLKARNRAFKEISGRGQNIQKKCILVESEAISSSSDNSPKYW